MNGLAPANTARIEVDIPVGSEWRYSGGGYTIIQQLLIDVTDRSFPSLMAEIVFQPLGMTSSTFEQPLSNSWIRRAAGGHQPGLGPVDGDFHVYPEMAAAGLWTTPTDLARFAIGVHEALLGKPGSVIAKSMASEMMTVHKGSYGLGVELSGDGRLRRFSHTGINEGFDSMLIAYCDLGTGAVVMANSNLSHGLITEIIVSIAEEYEWPDYPITDQKQHFPFSDEQLASYPGSYDLGDEFIVTVIREGDRLLMSIPNLGQTEIYSTRSGDSMFITGLPFPPFQFVTEESGIQIQFVSP